MSGKEYHKSTRLLWADVLRGILIILVVLGHSLQYGDYENRLSWNIINSFHMAAFFVISGYVNCRPHDFGKNILRRAQQLLIPFAIWTLIVGVIKRNVINHVTTSLLYPDSSFWFLWVLFCIVLLHELSLMLCKRITKPNLLMINGCLYLLLAISMVAFDLRMFGYQFFAYYFGFYALGYCLRFYNVNIPFRIAISCGVIWVGASIFWRKHAVPLPLQWIDFNPTLLNYGYRFVSAFCASVSLLGIAPIVFKNSTSRVLQLLAYLGKISLGIYVLHIILRPYIEPSLATLCNSNESLLFVCANTLINLCVSILIVQLILRSSILSKLLLGK